MGPRNTTIGLIICAFGCAVFALASLAHAQDLRAEDFFNSQIVARGSQYASTVRTLYILGIFSNVIVLLLLLWSRSGIQFRLWSAINADGNPIVMTALMALGTFILLQLVRLPLKFYRSHLIQHRYGLSTQSQIDWFKDWLLGLSLDGVFFIVAVLVVYRLILWTNKWWWLPASMCLGAYVVAHMWLAPIYLSPLFNSFHKLENKDLAQQIRTLAKSVNAPVEEVLVMDASRRTKRANAYYTGLWSTKRVVLYDNLVKKFTEKEILSIVGHELGHWKHKHIVNGVGIGIGGIFLALLVSSLMLSYSCKVGYFGLKDPADPANLPLLLLIFMFIMLIAQPIGMAISRHMERQADQTALELTKDAESFIEVERKLVRMNVIDLKPPRWAVLLLYTHPPVMERIGAAKAYLRKDNT